MTTTNVSFSLWLCAFEALGYAFCTSFPCAAAIVKIDAAACGREPLAVNGCLVVVLKEENTPNNNHSPS